MSWDSQTCSNYFIQKLLMLSIGIVQVQVSFKVIDASHTMISVLFHSCDNSFSQRKEVTDGNPLNFVG